MTENDWCELLRRGANLKKEVAQRLGGLLSTTQAAQVCSISEQTIIQRVQQGQILAVPLGHELFYPAQQFDEMGRVRQAVAEIIAASHKLEVWALLGILADTPEGHFGGTLLEALDRPDVRSDVLRRIATYGTHGAA